MNTDKLGLDGLGGTSVRVKTDKALLELAAKAAEHYEAALLAAFPHGASGEVFAHWNEARKLMGEAK